MHYRVTLNNNVRSHGHQIVRADTAEAAIEEAMKLDKWSEDETGDEADAAEPTFWVEPCDKDGDRIETDEGIDDEYRQDGYVYRSDLLSFVKMLAEAVAESNGLVNDDTGALMTPEGIRKTARHILNM